MSEKTHTLKALLQLDNVGSHTVRVTEGNLVSEEGKEWHVGDKLHVLGLGIKFYLSPGDITGLGSASGSVNIFYIDQRERLRFDTSDNGQYYIVTEDIYCMDTSEKETMHKLESKRVIRLLPQDSESIFFLQTNNMILCCPKTKFDQCFKRVFMLRPCQLLKAKAPLSRLCIHNQEHQLLFEKMTGFSHIPVTDSMQLALCILESSSLSLLVTPKSVENNISYVSGTSCINVTSVDLDRVKVQIEEMHDVKMSGLVFSVFDGLNPDGFSTFKSFCPCLASCNKEEFNKKQQPEGPVFVCDKVVYYSQHKGNANKPLKVKPHTLPKPQMTTNYHRHPKEIDEDNLPNYENTSLTPIDLNSNIVKKVEKQKLQTKMKELSIVPAKDNYVKLNVLTDPSHSVGEHKGNSPSVYQTRNKTCPPAITTYDNHSSKRLPPSDQNKKGHQSLTSNLSQNVLKLTDQPNNYEHIFFTNSNKHSKEGFQEEQPTYQNHILSTIRPNKKEEVATKQSNRNSDYDSDTINGMISSDEEISSGEETSSDEYINVGPPDKMLDSCTCISKNKMPTFQTDKVFPPIPSRKKEVNDIQTPTKELLYQGSNLLSESGEYVDVSLSNQHLESTKSKIVSEQRTNITPIQKQTTRIQDLSVSELCCFLQFYNLNGLALTCEKFKMDGQCLFEMDDSELMLLELKQIELFMFKRLKNGVFPKT